MIKQAGRSLSESKTNLTRGCPYKKFTFSPLVLAEAFFLPMVDGKAEEAEQGQQACQEFSLICQPRNQN
jgi:hypothetical protein